MIQLSGSMDVRRYPGFGLITWMALALLYIPLLVIAIYSFNAIRSTSSWGGFSFMWYEQAFTNAAIRSASLNSLVIGLVSAAISTLLAVPASFALVRNAEGRVKRIVQAGLNLPLVVPEIVLGVAMLVFFLMVGLGLGRGTVILAHTTFCIPFALLPIIVRLKSIDKSMEEAARDLYADRWRTFRYIYLPLLTPGILSGFILAFIVSLDDFIITSFVAGPGASTLPVTIYGMARNGFSPVINAVSTLLLAFSIISVVAASLLARSRTGASQ